MPVGDFSGAAYMLRSLAHGSGSSVHSRLICSPELPAIHCTGRMPNRMTCAFSSVRESSTARSFSRQFQVRSLRSGGHLLEPASYWGWLTRRARFAARSN